MKRIFTLILVITVFIGLVGCSDTKSTKEEELVVNDTVVTAAEDKQEEVVEEITEVVEEVKTREPINIAETAAWLDTLPREERYAWYEERYGTYFTDYVSYAEEWQAKGYVGVDADIYVSTYIGMPCELYDLLDISKVDDIMLTRMAHFENKAECVVDW